MHAETVQTANWWARPRADKAEAWIEDYQKSLHARHRDLIAQIVGEIGAETLLEIGAHCGPNLVRLADSYPSLKMIGVDANQEAIEAGQAWVKRLGMSDRIRLETRRYPDATDSMPSGACDIVLSCYTVAYVSPVDLDAALYEMGRLARKAVILAEPMRLSSADAPADVRNLSGYMEWAHDYQRALPWIGSLRGARSRVVPVDPPVDRLNGVLVIER